MKSLFFVYDSGHVMAHSVILVCVSGGYYIIVKIKNHSFFQITSNIMPKRYVIFLLLLLKPMEMSKNQLNENLKILKKQNG